MKFILVKSIAAGEYQDGKRSVEWLDLASGIHNIKLTKALLEEKTNTYGLVFDSDFGWCKKNKGMQKGIERKMEFIQHR